jgi:Mrp family chromosome partitioning ATPase
MGRRALAICAPTPLVGCTFVAANLAVAMAEVGIKTLLVDGDLRDPSIDKMINPSAPPEGLAGCLSHPGARIGDYIESDVLPNLSLFYAGPPSAREWFEDIVNFCLRDYELTIFDTPPANAYADARRICGLAGYGLVLARRNWSLVPDIQTLVSQIEADKAQVIGTVLNG